MSWQAWQIHFVDGKKALMLTDQCNTLEDALLASIERFGKKRIRTVLSNEQVKEVSTTAPNPFMEI